MANHFSASINVSSSSDEEDDFFDLSESPSSVPLIPFTNQVGGHAPFLRFTKKAVCKPLTEREKGFYESIERFHAALKEYTPIYLGVVNVTYPQVDATGSGNQVNVKPPSTPEVILEKNKHIFASLKKSSSHNRSRSSDSEKSPERRVANDDALKPIRSNSFSNSLAEELPQVNSAVDVPESPTEKMRKQFQYNVFKEVLSPKSRKNWEKFYKKSVKDMFKDFVKNEKNASLLTSEIERDDLGADSPKSPCPTSAPIQIPSSSVQLNAKPTSLSTSCPENEIASPTETTKEEKSEPTFFNPWSMQMYANTLQKYIRSSSAPSSSSPTSGDTQQFIMLQDLTDGLHLPCILDLKMGTRQYGIDSNQKKRESQIRKAQKTTSASLGVRICGMQVYQITTKTFYFQDKYDGRKLGIDQFKETLSKYLHNGRCLVREFLPPLIAKLLELKRVVSELNEYRFYSSSLLLLYDGFCQDDYDSNGTNCLKDKVEAGLYKNRKIDIRIIDFSNSVSPLNYEQSYAKDPSIGKDQPDTGYILGLESLIKCFQEIYDSV